jgi:hypothetical protein
MDDLVKLLKKFNVNEGDNASLFHQYFVGKMNKIFQALNEADPIAAGREVDFQNHMADPSRYTISHNMPSPMDDMSGMDGMGNSSQYDGTDLQGNANGSEPAGMPPMPGMNGAGEDQGSPDMGAGQAGAGPMRRPQTPMGMPT